MLLREIYMPLRGYFEPAQQIASPESPVGAHRN
jgi:hypothetical protein